MESRNYDRSPSRQGQTTPALPDQQQFQQHLRELARAGIRIVLEGVMREELDALIGVGGHHSGYPLAQNLADMRLKS